MWYTKPAKCCYHCHHVEEIGTGEYEERELNYYCRHKLAGPTESVSDCSVCSQFKTRKGDIKHAEA